MSYLLARDCNMSHCIKELHSSSRVYWSFRSHVRVLSVVCLAGPDKLAILGVYVSSLYYILGLQPVPVCLESAQAKPETPTTYTSRVVGYYTYGETLRGCEIHHGLRLHWYHFTLCQAQRRYLRPQEGASQAIPCAEGSSGQIQGNYPKPRLRFLTSIP